MIASQQHEILSYTSVMAILAGVAIMAMAIQCATHEAKAWMTRSMDTLPFSHMVFDLYRSFAVAGGTSVVIGVANLMLPFVSRDLLPAGINWPVELGGIFFLAMRLRYYHTPCWRPLDDCK